MMSLVLWALIVSSRAATPTDDEIRYMFKQFKNRFNKAYAEEEEADRFAAFTKNIGRAAGLNDKRNVDCAWGDSSSGVACPYGVTPFSDMHKEEFAAKMLGYKPSNKTNRGLRAMDPSQYAHARDVSSKDWRAEGKVTAMKDQNPCGVCWAFSAASTLESAYAIKYSTSPPVLSPEEIVECDGTHSCDGSDSGGNYEQAWQYLQQHGGLSTEADYPTTCCDETSDPQIGQCRTTTPKITVTGVSDGPQDEDELAAAVAAQGPFSIAVAADSWQHWTGGTTVMTECDGDVDHAVSIVGFNKNSDTPYWIVRNQWGTNWGDQGYIYLAMGQNMCKLTTEPAIAQVGDVGPGPSPTPTPPTPPTPPSASHYEDPKDGCQSDELSMQIQDVAGAVCAPSCDVFTACPTDVPTGVTADPQCTLQDSSGNQYCALVCTPSDTNDAQCGTNASCKYLQDGTGMCTYDDDAGVAIALTTQHTLAKQSAIVV